VWAGVHRLSDVPHVLALAMLWSRNFEAGLQVILKARGTLQRRWEEGCEEIMDGVFVGLKV